MSSALGMSGVSAGLQYDLTNLYGSASVSPSFPSPVTVSAKAPDIVQESFTSGGAECQVNLFLHQVTHNVGWRNQDLPSVGPDGATRLSNPPLALDLHYLLTAYGSENWEAEALLGYALQMLHENPVLTRHDINHAIAGLTTLDPGNPLSTQLVPVGLADQIEMLKITPATLGREEMAWLWTALKADYRPTFPFQVSVVLIESQHPAVLPLLKFFIVQERQHGLARVAEHRDRKTHRDVVAVIAVLIVDDVPTWLPERLATPDDARRLALELEQHLALDDIAEHRS